MKRLRQEVQQGESFRSSVQSSRMAKYVRAVRAVFSAARFSLSLMVALLLLSPTVSAQRDQQVRPVTRRLTEREERFINDQLKEMRLEEKVGQMIMITTESAFMNVQSEPFQDLRRRILENKVGGIVLGIGNVYEGAILINRLQELAKIPLLVAADLETGPVMRIIGATAFPYNMGIGATGDPEMASAQGRVTALEARALGINMVFAPVADVNNNPDNPIINVRSYGEDPQQVARMVVAFIRAVQQNGVIATAKHFPGHGDTRVDSHRSLPVITVDRQRLDAIELVPFRSAVAAGVGAIMSAHIALPQIDPTPAPPLQPAPPPDRVFAVPQEIEYEKSATVPATLSEKILTGLLRTEMKFDGLIVTDSMRMGGIIAHFEPAEAAVRAVQAGADILLSPPDVDLAVSALVEAVRRKEITEARIDASVRRVLRAKMLLGLFAGRFSDIDALDTRVASPAAMEAAQAAANRALTLLRDNKKLIPIASPAEKRILNLVITTDEDRFTAGRVLGAELQKRAPKTETFVVDSRTSSGEIQTVLERVNRFDVIVAGLFIRPRSYRGSISLPDPGDSLLRALIARDLPLIVVSFGNPYFLLNYKEIGTYLLGWGDYRDSVPSQRAVAGALLGEVSITGKLPVTFPWLYSRGHGMQVKVEEMK